MTTQDKNAVIALWMGLSYCEKYQYEGWYKNHEHNHRICDYDGLKYHSDWNWLHQAISKISELKETPELLGWRRNNWTIFDSPIITAKIETTFDLVYQFVVWHNQRVKENRRL